MSVLQNINLADTTIKMRWQEPYITTGLNQKSVASDARGVVAGFKVAPSSGYVVEVQVDPGFGLSIANVLDTTGGNFALTVIQPTPMFVDLTAQAGSTVFIALDAQYAVGSPTTAQLKVVDAAELAVNDDLVLLARVTVPASPPVVVANINMGYRLRSGDSVPVDAKPYFNELFNGDFESDANGSAAPGWTLAGGTVGSTSTDFAKTGTKSLKLVVSSTGTSFSSYVPVIAGETYRVGLWTRTAAGGLTGTGMQLRAAFFDRNYVLLSTSDVDAPLTGVVTTFAERKALVVAPLNAAHGRIELFFDGTTTGTAYVDDVEFAHPRADALARAAVFGGGVADAYHSHTAAGQAYAGGANWADLTPNPPTTIENELDKIILDLGTTSSPGGAARIGYVPQTPVDLTGLTRVDQALNTLDDLKAGINIANTFTKTNTFTPSVLNTSGIITSGNGTAAGLVSSGSLAGSHGVIGGAIGAGYGVYGNAPAGGVYGFSTAANGVTGQASGAGAGVSGIGGTSGPGGIFVGGSSGNGVTATGGGTGAGVVGNAGGGAGAIGVSGVGSSGPGVQGSSTTNNGVYGIGGSSGSGVYGENTNAGGYGVAGRATHATGVAVLADATGGGVGLQVNSTSTGNGIQVSSVSGRAVEASNNHATVATARFQNQGNGSGIIGLANNQTGSVNGTGVFGKGSVGGWFTSGSTSGLGLEVVGGTPNGIAIEALGLGTGYALDAYNGSGSNSSDVIGSHGYIKFLGDNPGVPASPGFPTTGSAANRLTGANFIKAWGQARSNSGSPILINGYNISSMSITANECTVTMINGMTSAAYVVVACSPSDESFVRANVSNATTFTLKGYHRTGGIQGWSAADFFFQFMVVGMQ